MLSSHVTTFQIIREAFLRACLRDCLVEAGGQSARGREPALLPPFWQSMSHPPTTFRESSSIDAVVSQAAEPSSRSMPWLLSPSMGVAPSMTAAAITGASLAELEAHDWLIGSSADCISLVDVVRGKSLGRETLTRRAPNAPLSTERAWDGGRYF